MCSATIDGFESVRGGLRLALAFSVGGGRKTDIRLTGLPPFELSLERGLRDTCSFLISPSFGDLVGFLGDFILALSSPPAASSGWGASFTRFASVELAEVFNQPSRLDESTRFRFLGFARSCLACLEPRRNWAALSTSPLQSTSAFNRSDCFGTFG